MHDLILMPYRQVLTPFCLSVNQLRGAAGSFPDGITRKRGDSPRAIHGIPFLRGYGKNRLIQPFVNRYIFRFEHHDAFILTIMIPGMLPSGCFYPYHHDPKDMDHTGVRSMITFMDFVQNTPSICSACRFIFQVFSISANSA